jgi:4-aminobutyrate aminotransferase-like enzyme
MGNGVPVNAAVGRKDVLGSLKYGEGSDTWSAAPLGCAAVLATLDEFETADVLGNTARLNKRFCEGLSRLKETGLIAKVRGEGMVFGIECASAGSRSPQEVANDVVRTCYVGETGGAGVHLLGPLAGKVLRVSPPLTMTEDQAADSLELLYRLIGKAAKV